MQQNTISLRSPFHEAIQGGPLTELDKARAEADKLRAEAAAAVAKAEKLRASMLRSTRDAKFRLRATAAVMMTAALLKLAWQAANATTPVPVPERAQPLPPSAAAPASVNPAPAQAGEDGEAVDPSPGALALERLRTAFHSFPDEDQWEVVRQVNERYAGAGLACPLEWKDGIPALYVGDKKGDAPPSMVKALNQCSEGVEKLRLERDAQKAP